MGLTGEQARERLVVALDASDEEAIIDLARSLVGVVGMVKVGLEAFTAAGPGLVERLHALGLPVFVDLKLHDIPNTVERAAANLSRLGARLLTVHAAGGAAMLRAAVAGAAAGAHGAGDAAGVLAVTVLTSIDDATLAELGIPGGAADRVLAWATMARREGCRGMVCSPREVAALRSHLGGEVVLVTPGIRPAGSATEDQRRVATPAAAVAAGATYLVVGRPITRADDPAAAAAAIVDEMRRP